MTQLTSSLSATLTKQSAKPSHNINAVLFRVLCVLTLLVSSHVALKAEAATSNEIQSPTVKPEYIFKPSETSIADVKNTLLKANAENKYALIVLGAQWCHDSTGLAAKFSTERMQAVLSAGFVTHFVDVAYLEDRRNITNLLGYPNYFATPTVLIVNPTNNTVVNINSLTTWQSADSVDLDEYIEHFSSWSKPAIRTKAATSKTNAALSAFELRQSTRLQNAYTALGPLLEASESIADDEQSKEASQAFIHLWREVKKFRTHLQADIHKFRNSDMSDAQFRTELDKATLKPQSWEIK